MAKDFRASQVETSKLILSGGIASKVNLGLAVYSGSKATNREGGIPNVMLSKVGKDVTVFVSGTIGSRDSSTGGSILFGGDAIISGSLTVRNEGQAGGTISGSIHHTEDGTSYLVAGTNTTISSASNGQITIATTGGASNAFSTIAVAADGGSASGANSTADSNTDTLTLLAGSGITLTNSSGGDDRIKIEASSGGIWTDEGDIYRPSDNSGNQSVGLGSTGNTAGNYKIFLGSDGSSVFNEGNANVNFRVESQARPSAVLVDGSSNQVVVLGGGLDASNSYGTNAASTALPTDISIFISGSCNQQGVLNSFGTAVIGGDLVVSGNFKTIPCNPAGDNQPGFEYDPGNGSNGTLSVGAISSINSMPAGSLVSAGNVANNDPSITLVEVDSSIVAGNNFNTIVSTAIDNNGGLTNISNVASSSPSSFITTVAQEDFTNALAGSSLQIGGQTAGLNASNSGKIWMEIGSPGPFLPDQPHAVGAGSGTNIAPLIQFGTATQPVNFQMMGGHMFGASPLRFSMTGSKDAAGFHNTAGNHLAMIITGSILVSGSTNTCGGTISGSIHHTRDGNSYLIGGSGITISSASNGQITVTATGGGSVRTVGVDTDGNGSTDNTLAGGEDLILKAGTNMTLAEAGGVVTFNASGGGSSTLDQAYDQGGSGAGRFITADGGPVQIDASGDALAGLAITGSSGGNLIDFKVGSNLNATIKHTTNYDLVIQNTGDNSSGNGHIILNAVGGNANVVLGNGSNLTKLVFNGNEATQPSSPYIYTSTAGNSADLILDVPNNQSIVFNEDGQSSDFRVESNTLQSAILVDGGEDTVVLGSGLANYASLPADAKGTDVNVVISGSAGSRGTGTAGTLLAAGDVVISGSLIVGNGAAGASPGGTISGSIHHTRDGLSYLVAGTGVTIASASNGQVTIGTAGGGGSFSQFFIEDDAGTEVTIDNDKELKFVGGTGINTLWTDTSDGSDADPYDLTLSMTGSVMTATYGQDGPHKLQSTVAQQYEGSSADLADCTFNSEAYGAAIVFGQSPSNTTHAVGLRTTVPNGATKISIILQGAASSGSGAVELRIAARLHSATGAKANNANSTSGNWTSVLNNSGWIFFGNGAGANTNASDKKIDIDSTNMKTYRSPQFNIGQIVNNADDPSQEGVAPIDGGQVIDIMICRNRSSNVNNQINGNSPATNDTMGGLFKVPWIQLEYA